MKAMNGVVKKYILTNTNDLVVYTYNQLNYRLTTRTVKCSTFCKPLKKEIEKIVFYFLIDFQFGLDVRELED